MKKQIHPYLNKEANRMLNELVHQKLILDPTRNAVGIKSEIVNEAIALLYDNNKNINITKIVRKVTPTIKGNSGKR